MKSGEATVQGARSHTAGPAIAKMPAHTHISPCARGVGGLMDGG